MKLSQVISKLAGKNNSTIAVPVEFTARDIEVLKYTINSGITMSSAQRVIPTIQACKYVIEHEIEGDFLECGVWRGGHSIAAKLIFEAYGADRQVYLYNTFAGMTEPTVEDVTVSGGRSAMAKFQEFDRGDHNDWCFASLTDVQRNFVNAGTETAGVTFVKDDVVKTLAEAANLPEKIAVLRLDTDWYESTKSEMNILYPLLSDRGAFLVDDYGHWDGARKAIEEYFEASKDYKRPLMQYTDYTGRMEVK